jgi:hypothetical protein
MVDLLAVDHLSVGEYVDTVKRTHQMRPQRTPPTP